MIYFLKQSKLCESQNFKAPMVPQQNNPLMVSWQVDVLYPNCPRSAHIPVSPDASAAAELPHMF